MLFPYQNTEGMAFPSPYFLPLIKVDRISIIGSGINGQKNLPVAAAADLMIKCDNNTSSNKRRENIDMA